LVFDEEVPDFLDAVYRRLTTLNNQDNNSRNNLSQDSLEDNYQLNDIFDQMQTQEGLEQIWSQHRQHTNLNEELDQISTINNSILDTSYLQNNFEEQEPYYNVSQIERYLNTCNQAIDGDQSFNSNFNNSSFTSRNLNDVSQSTSFQTNFSDIQLNSSIDHSYNDLLQITDFINTEAHQPELQLEFDNSSNSDEDVVILHAHNNSFAQINSDYDDFEASYEIQSGQKISNPNISNLTTENNNNDTIDSRGFDVDVLDFENNLLEASEKLDNNSTLNQPLFDSINSEVEEVIEWYEDRKRKISEVDEISENESLGTEATESEDSFNQEGGANYFSIEERQSRENLHFGSRQVAFRLNFHNLPSDLNHLNNILLDAINNLRNSIRSMHPNDFVQFFMMHDNLDNPIVSPVVRWNQLTAEYILNLIDETVQSNKTLAINTNMFIYLTVIKSISGGSGRLLNYIKNRKRIFSNLQNTDKMCLLRAIILGKNYVDYNYYKKKYGPKSNEYLMSFNDYKNFNKNEFRLSVEVGNLANKLRISENRECGISDVIHIEKYLKDYQISVLRGDNYEWEYEGEKKERRINLIHIEIPEINVRHFELIKSLPAVFNKRYYCLDCKKAYQTFSDHKCNKVCFCCKDIDCSKIKHKRKKCEKCELVCNGEECYVRHRETRCSQIVFCEKCYNIKSKIHVCFDERWCSNCNKAVLMEHSCCILTQKERDIRKKNNKNDKFKGFIFFDYECMNENGIHRPNLVVADKVCIKCLNEWKSLEYNKKSKDCQELDCGVQSFNTNEKFCLWL
jgi:hypothetical protein